MKKRAMSLLLVLLMVVTLFPTFALPAAAAGETETGTITNPEPAQDDTNDLNLTKVLTPGENGTYDLTMNAWATGEVVTNQTVEKVPTDFVVVVDQSGSMDKDDMATGGYTPAGTINLEDVENGRYYYKDGEQYYRVYAKKGYLYQYHPGNTLWVEDIKDHTNAKLTIFQRQKVEDFTLYGQYYVMSPNDHQLCLMNLAVSGKFLAYAFNFSYKDSSGTHNIPRPKEPWFMSINGHIKKKGDNWDWTPMSWSLLKGDYDYTYSEIAFDFFGSHYELGNWGMMIDFPLFSRHIGYTELCYKDLNGDEQVITTTTGKTETQWCDAPVTVNGKTQYNALTEYENGQRMQYDSLYTASGKQTRLEALQKALTEFADTIADETDSFGAVDNRISIVGFSSDGYNNNELLTNTANGFSVKTTDWTTPYNSPSSQYSIDGRAHDGIQYEDATSDDYAKALVNATNGEAGTVNPAITEAIKGITAHGGTEPQTGLNMAYQVLTNRGDATYAYRSEDKLGETTERNQVVIFFTDGQPGSFAYSNQYAAANAVVEKAKTIKDLDATIFSIGVFGESDGNPLTQILQDENGNYAGPLDAAEPAYEYYHGWVDTVQVQGSYYYLARQWRPGDAANYGERANDTIFDYMSVVSSNYPEAEHFITAAWLNGNHQGTYLQATNGVRGTAEATNKYYRMASNQATLIDAFLMAATSTSETYTSGTAVLVDKDAIFKDKVNLADFDIANATYTVQIEPVAMVGNELVRDTSREVSTPVSGAKVPSTGEITYTNFDYSTSYVTSIHPGARLIVTINGLAPKKAGGTLKSNADTDNEHYAAGIYGKGLDTPAVQIASPTLDLSTVAATKTYVIDTNAKTRLATESHQLVAADNNDNGVFAKSADKGPYDVTYQLNAGVQNGTVDSTTKQYAATINSAYTTVDTAMVYGKPYDLDAEAFADKAGWTKIVTVPASSVYYDDSFTEENAQVLNYPGDVVAQTGTFDGSNSHIFTFYGTGIDVYCTTNDNGGYVSARVYQGNTTSGTVEGTVTVKNQSQGAYYNTPTVHFADLTPGYHTVWIYANGNANYQIDGVRVYNPVKATEDGKTTEAAAELAKTDEANAHYFNLHDLLLNASSDYSAISKEQYASLEAADAVAVSGVLYLDNAANICLQSNDAQGKAQLIFNSDFNLYEKNSPINEIYLQTTNGQPQGVAFKLANYPLTGEKVYLGVSAPKGSGIVYINNHELTVSSSVDQYYDITAWIATTGETKGVVSIKTGTDDTNLISVTNLKITGVTAEAITGQNPPADAANNSNSLNSYRRLAFAPMTTATVEEIAQETVPELFAVEPENPGTPDTPETPDQPDDPTPGAAGSVQEMLKQLFESLMKNLFGLFKGLGNW